MNDAMQRQVGGSHYKDMKIEPFEFGTANNYDPATFSVMKYITRHRGKNGLEDLNKAIHIVDIRVAMFVRYGLPRPATSTILVGAYVYENNIPKPEARALLNLHLWACLGRDETFRADAVHMKSLIEEIAKTYKEES